MALAYRRDRDGGARPEPREGKITTPAGLPKGVQTVFRRLVRELQPAGILKPVDVELLAQLAAAIWLERQALAALEQQGVVREDEAHGGRLGKSPWFTIWRDAGATVRGLSGRFGLSPADRERLSIAESDETVIEYLEFLLRGQRDRS